MIADESDHLKKQYVVTGKQYMVLQLRSNQD